MKISTVIVICFSSLLSFVQSEKPHVVFVFADDLGWGDVGFHGSAEIPTPNLDALAYDGIMLGNYYVQPICTPSRAALMTSRHPIHLGLQHSVIHTPEPFGLSLKEKIMPQYLKELNYSTHAIGKWHLGFYTKEHTPTFRGFDTHFGYFSGRGDYWDHTINEGYWALDFRRNMEPVKTKFGQYSTELFTQEAESIIANHDVNQPLFLYFAHQAVHSANSWKPLEAQFKHYSRLKHIENTRRRTYAAMLASLDESFGRVVKALSERNMLQNSIIVFSTDNGGAAANYNQNVACNLPLRGNKETLWEGGMRGAAFVWSPLLMTSRYTSQQLIHVTDWLPTLLSAAGYDMTSLPTSLCGVDQWQVLSSQQHSKRDEILHNIEPVDGSYAIRKGGMKLVFASKHSHSTKYPYWYGPIKATNRTNCDTTPRAQNLTNEITVYNATIDYVTPVLDAIGRHDVKPRPFRVDCGKRPEDFYTNCDFKKHYCLFNITADPCEYSNIADDHPDVINHLLALVRSYSSTAVPIRNKKPDSRSNPKHFGGVWSPWLNKTCTSLHC